LLMLLKRINELLQCHRMKVLARIQNAPYNFASSGS
jgi:hypothetical protein